MKGLAIGGVPEHFNLPWHLLIESGALRARGIHLQWRDFPDGTGAMASALSRNEVDIAMLLTEGAVAGIAQGGRYAVVSLYTQSRLIWGIHVSGSSQLREIADIEGARYAISRLGSGSHLMCYVHARDRGWPLESLKFVTVRTLEGAVEAFAAGTADVFFWEKFMTKPIVDSGTFRRIGEFAAPWPAWVVCASRAALEEKTDLIAPVLTEALGAASELAASDAAAAQIAGRYRLHVSDVAEWLRSTKWSSKVGIEESDVAPVIKTLQQVGLVSADFTPQRVIATLG
jgi:sulfonate transport system substrate-binding protein